MTKPTPPMSGLRQRQPDDDHFFRVEVTVAACIATPENRALGDNMADATLAFSMSATRPPDGLSDEFINASIARNISPVLAAISVTLTSLGFAALGVTDEPMTERSRTVGFGHTSPVRVQLVMPDDVPGGARA